MTIILLFFLITTIALSVYDSQTGDFPEVMLVNNSINSQTGESVVIIGDSELAAKSNGGSGTKNDPYRLRARTIESDETCIRIENTTAYFEIQGGKYEIDVDDPLDSEPVIRLRGVEHGIIRDCYTSGGKFGIELLDVANINIENCMMRKSYIGISLDMGDNCTIRDSRIFHNEIGAYLLVATNSMIFNNSIYANTGIGFDIGFYSENNSIYQNRIGWNTEINAVDDGIDNSFSANEWSDHHSTGAYSIYGNDQSTDSSATRLVDINAPTIVDLRDIVIDVESTSEYITWTCSDSFPDRYEIFIDDNLEIQDLWDGEKVTFRIDQLPEGVYDVTLNVTDAAGNTRSGIVIVTVISYMLGGIGTELVMLASGVTLVVFLVIILIVKKVL